jgi:hypothetical protein
MIGNSRRRFLTASGGAALGVPFLAPFLQLATTANGQIREELRARGSGQDPDIDVETLDFWTKEVRSKPSSGLRPAAVSGTAGSTDSPALWGRKRRPTIDADPAVAPLLSSRAEREPVFYLYDRQSGFQAAGDLKPDIMPRKGDLDVMLQVLECRPSADEQTRMSQTDAGSLRIDVQQGHPLPQLDEPLAWSALASLLPETNKEEVRLNGTDFNLSSSWGQTKRIPLPGGRGFWTWNMFLKDRESPWWKFIDFARSAGRVAGPYVMGLPAIAKTALGQVDGILGQIQSMKRSRWVFQCRDVEICGTREALDKVGGRAIHLQNGQYILVPVSQADQFEEKMGGLQLVDGKLVPANTTQGRLRRTAASTLPELTYVTVHVTSRPRDFLRCPGA